MQLRRTIKLFCIASILLSSACVRGFLYTDVTSPLTQNFEQTPIAERSVQINSDEVRIPLPRGSLATAWNSRALGDAARRGGLSSVYYADEHELSVLGGIWKRRTVTVYGN